MFRAERTRALEGIYLLDEASERAAVGRRASDGRRPGAPDRRAERVGKGASVAMRQHDKPSRTQKCKCASEGARPPRRLDQAHRVEPSRSEHASRRRLSSRRFRDCLRTRAGQHRPKVLTGA